MKNKQDKRKKYKIIISILITIILASIAGIVVGSINLSKGKSEDVKVSSNLAIFEGTNEEYVNSEEEALEYIERNADRLGIDDVNDVEFTDTKSSKDNTYYNFEQYYGEIPVYGSKITVMTSNSDKDGTDQSGKVLLTMGDYTKVDDNTPTEPTVSASKIKKKLKEELEKNHDFENVKDIKTDELTKEHLVIYFDTEEKAYLAYEYDVKFVAKNGTYSYTVISDATNGEVLKAYSNIVTGEATTAKVDGITINTYKENDGKYILYDESRNILIMDSDKRDCALSIVEESEIKEGVRQFIPRVYLRNVPEFVESKDNINWNADATKLMVQIKKNYDWYQAKFGIKGPNNKNSIIVGQINDGIDNGNNASYSGVHGTYNTSLRFGYGESFKNLNMDIVAHEYGHAVQDGILDMAYLGETGAIMEAYADTMGEIIEGDSSWCSSVGRNLANPKKSGNPKKYKGTYWEKDTENKKDSEGKTTNDNGHVHKNSTVMSHVSYLLSVGIDGSDEKKISNDDIAKLWYETFHLCTKKTNFMEFRLTMEYMARVFMEKEVFTGEQYQCVCEAFQKVGLSKENSKLVTNVNKNGKLIIKDTFGYPLDGAKVELQGEKNYKYEYKADDNGEVYLNVEADDYTVTIEDSKDREQQKFLRLISCKEFTGTKELDIVTYFRKNIVREVNLLSESITMNVDGVLTADVEIIPKGVSDYTITWTSSDSNVVSVDKKGMLQAHSPGIVTIDIEIKNNGNTFNKQISVEVIQKQRDTIMVLDVSGSMDGEPLEEMKKSAKKFCRDLLLDGRGDNQVEIITYDDYVDSTGFSDDYDYLVNYIDGLYDKGRTNTQGALERAYSDMNSNARENSIKNIMILSDGIPNEGQTSQTGSMDEFCYENNIQDDYRMHGNGVCDMADTIMVDYNLYSLAFLHDLNGLEAQYCEKLMSYIQNHGYYQVDKAENLQLSFDGISSDVSDGSKIVIKIACPVDVTVKSGNEVLSSADTYRSAEASFGTLQKMGINNDVKLLTLDSGRDYDIDLKGNGAGTMDYMVSYYGKDDFIEDERNFKNVPIQPNTLIATNTNQNRDTKLEIDSDGDGKKDLVWMAAKNSEGKKTKGKDKKQEPLTDIDENSGETAEDSDTNIGWIVLIIVCSVILIVCSVLLIVVIAKYRKLDDAKYSRETEIKKQCQKNDAVTTIDIKDAKENNDSTSKDIHITDGSKAKNLSEKSGQKTEALKLSEKQSVKITLLSGEMAGAEIGIKNDEQIIVGKDSLQAQIVVPSEYKRVSRVHCRISYNKEQGKLSVTDLSTNGTFVNGKRIEPKVALWLKNGSVVELTKNGFRFSVNISKD